MSQKTTLANEIRMIRSSFRALAKSFGRIEPVLSEVSSNALAGLRPRKNPRLSRAKRASLKLQGKYMGTMRGLPPRKRATVKRIRAERGIRAAIAAARRMPGWPVCTDTVDLAVFRVGQRHVDKWIAVRGIECVVCF